MFKLVDEKLTSSNGVHAHPGVIAEDFRQVFRERVEVVKG